MLANHLQAGSAPIVDAAQTFNRAAEANASVEPKLKAPTFTHGSRFAVMTRHGLNGHAAANVPREGVHGIAMSSELASADSTRGPIGTISVCLK